jgi:flavin-dependent dehydrogenase
MRDVFIVGGGPAGLAAAIAARLKGFEVTVSEAAPPPIDKACGEGLMPDAIAALAHLGVSITPEDGYPFRGIRFLGSGAVVEADFPYGLGVGVRRTRLHAKLADRAASLGVKLLWGRRATVLPENAWVVGADGQGSRIRAAAGLEKAPRASTRFGFRRHFRIPPWTDHVEVHWGPGFQIYVTPVGAEEVCIALLCRDSQIRLSDALPHFPDLDRRLAGIACGNAERGALTCSRRLERIYCGRTVLIGDASGSVDAITGEGLCLAFHQAFALAGALESGNLEAYQAAHREILKRPMRMGDLMLLLDRFAWLRPPALRAMQWQPAIFRTLLAVHVGAASAVHFENENLPALSPVDGVARRLL